MTNWVCSHCFLNLGIYFTWRFVHFIDEITQSDEEITQPDEESFNVGLQSQPTAHPPSYKVYPWHTWTPVHRQGLHPQLDGELLPFLGWHPYLTSCLSWRHGNHGLQGHWNLPRCCCGSRSITFTSQTGRWSLFSPTSTLVLHPLLFPCFFPI